MSATLLWKEYKQTKSSDAMNRLVEHYFGFVRHLVGRMLIPIPVTMDKDDLIGYGVLGLMEAIERFDDSRGYKFESFASYRIQGAIRDQLRYDGKTVGGLGRSGREKAKRIQSAIAELEKRLCRHPTTNEIVSELGITFEEYSKLLFEINEERPLSLDRMIGGDKNLQAIDVVKDERSKSPDELYLQKHYEEELPLAIDRLPEKERLIISLYYYEELTLAEIAKVLNLSEGRISQLHSTAMLRLKNALTGGDSYGS